MSYFFDQPKASQSQYQNTAFFQEGQGPKASIFDQNIKSQSQVAYDLFNVEEKGGNERERSIISLLDLVERPSDEESFAPPLQPINQKSGNVGSQESKMTFGGMQATNLYQSKVQQHKIKNGKICQVKQEKNVLDRGLNSHSSNFYIFKTDNFNCTLKEPQSMPITLKEKKESPKKLKFDGKSSNCSSITIDFEQIRQRQLQQSVAAAKGTQSLKLINEQKKEKVQSKSSESSKTDKSNFHFKQPCSTIQLYKPQGNSTFVGIKQKKFEFNLRRSKVESISPKPINIASLVQNPEGKEGKTGQVVANGSIKSQQLLLKNEVKLSNDHHNQLFKSRVKQGDRFSLNCIKLRQSEIKPLKFLKPTIDELKNIQIQKPAIQVEKQVKVNKQLKMDVEQKMDLISNNDSEHSNQRRESIGLKDQLKKLSSRPTERFQLKSIALNKGFKLKSKIGEEKTAQKVIAQQLPSLPKEIKSAPKEENIVIQRTIEIKDSSKLKTIKDTKKQSSPIWGGKNSNFSRYMLILMQLQQESEMLRQRVSKSRNSYRELGIINDDINRRIDQILVKK